MENQHRKIKGYRELNEKEIETMNKVKETGKMLDELVLSLQFESDKFMKVSQKMVDIVEQLCIKSYEIKAQNGDCFKAEQGKLYTTTVPTVEKNEVTVFSNYCVPIPKEHFVISENCPYTKRLK